MSEQRGESYFIYENWQADGHKAKIHLGSCRFCNDGKGIHPEAGVKNGRWHGPYFTLQNALRAAKDTGSRVSRCKKCNPE